MQPIKNGYAEYYYLTKDGKIYNDNTKKYLSIDQKHSYKLLQCNGEYKRISLKKLYRLVYDKVYCIDLVSSFENEVWKEIEGTQGNYLISNYGRVKSLCKYEAFILKPTITKNGYERLQIKQDGRSYNKLVHRLVAANFLPAPPTIDWQLHHIDFNKRNNKTDNLIWLSISDHAKVHSEKNSSLEADPSQIKEDFTQTH